MAQNEVLVNIIKQSRVDDTSSHEKVLNWIENCPKFQHELDNNDGIVNLNKINNFDDLQFVYKNNDYIDINNITNLHSVNLIQIPQCNSVLEEGNTETNYNFKNVVTEHVEIYGNSNNDIDVSCSLNEVVSENYDNLVKNNVTKKKVNVNDINRDNNGDNNQQEFENIRDTVKSKWNLYQK